MRFHPTSPLSVIRPDRLTLQIGSPSTAIDHASVASEIHAAVLAALPDPNSDIAIEYDVELRFDFAPYLTMPLTAHLRLAIFVDADDLDPGTDPAVYIDAVVANEVDRAIRDYGLDRVIADAQVLQVAIRELVDWDGRSIFAIVKALRDAEIIAVTYGADPTDLIRRLPVAKADAAGRILVVDHAGRLAPGSTVAPECDDVLVKLAA